MSRSSVSRHHDAYAAPPVDRQNLKRSMPAAAPVSSPRPRVRRVYSKKGAPLPSLFYWVLIGAFCFCAVQCIRTTVTEGFKLTQLSQKQPIIEAHYGHSIQENKILQERISNSSTRHGIEAMARNYLNLTGNGEILVRLH